ncbi:MAG: metalloregulator ArsR/SmtB family transcription factor [Gemmatimonadaceae bacterium]|nr:metalloregulator ArsR/SmtB family transcription factor [Gemmatimonadaceae bacterium]
MKTIEPLKIARGAALFHALSDETRLEILRQLSSGECCVCDLTDALDSAQSRLSFHLKVLKDAGFVSDRKQGRWVYYRLNAEAFAEAGEVVGTLEKLAEESASSTCYE